jgi:hypothetical protein
MHDLGRINLAPNRAFARQFLPTRAAERADSR